MDIISKFIAIEPVKSACMAIFNLVSDADPSCVDVLLDSESGLMEALLCRLNDEQNKRVNGKVVHAFATTEYSLQAILNIIKVSSQVQVLRLQVTKLNSIKATSHVVSHFRFLETSTNISLHLKTDKTPRLVAEYLIIFVVTCIHFMHINLSG